MVVGGQNTGRQFGALYPERFYNITFSKYEKNDWGSGKFSR